MRSVVIHCHLFKNAGTTFDWSLHRNFGDGFYEYNDAAKLRSEPGFLASYIIMHPSLQAFSSHHVQFPMPEVKAVRLWPVVLLRHPIDRVGSVYAFEARQKADTPGAKKAKKTTFAEYVTWRMQPRVGSTIRNFQTRYCCSRQLKSQQQVEEADYEAARQHLQQTALVGIVDRYDESMVLFEEALRPVFPAIDLTYLPRNVTPGREQTQAARVQKVKDELGPEVSRLVTEKNQFDMRLYNMAKELLDTRIATTPNFAEKLAAFQQRCQVLSPQD